MKNEKNMFEIATRERFRFTFKGQQSVEDLWLLSEKELNSIFQELNSKVKKTQEESLLEIKTKQDEELILKIEIVKYIFQTIKNENLARLQAKENEAKKQKIMELMAKKQEEGLQNMSMEDLQKMLDDLN